MVTRHPIRKVFVKTQDAGDEPAYWDHQWEDVNAAAKAREASEDPSSLERLIAAGLASGPILEAGCGSGWAVEWLASLGPLTVGLDFARRSLGQAKGQFPDKSFIAGDLERLPFADASFGTVVSLRLEHIELGPARALSEHRRVLKTGGRLLITLPRISWIKAANDLVGRHGGRIDHYLSPRGRWVSREAQFRHEDAGDLRFVQYELWANEWRVLLGQSGFDVLSYRPVLVGGRPLARAHSSGICDFGRRRWGPVLAMHSGAASPDGSAQVGLEKRSSPAADDGHRARSITDHGPDVRAHGLLRAEAR